MAERQERQYLNGRPSMSGVTTYSEDIANKICDIISTSSRGLSSICSEENMPSPSTVYKWLNDIQGFSDKYTRARVLQADFLSDEIIEIADDSSKDTKTITTRSGEEIEVENTEWVNRSKLRVEARKWKASKLAPKKYGEKLDLTSDGEKLKGTVVQWGDREITI